MYIDLQKIVTRDGIVLDGGAILPKRRGTMAFVFIHGLSGNFYGWFSKIQPLVRRCTQKRIAFFSFNNRGAGVVTSLYRNRKNVKRLRGGAAFEHFSECVLDIRAAIDFLGTHGYRNIVLVGHSTGANKAVYYLWKTRDRRVKHVVLLGPLSDVVGEMQLRGRRLPAFLKKARTQVRTGKGHELFRAVLPEYVWSAARYLSLSTSGSAEDTFPYYRKNGNWRAVESIRVPLTVIVGSNDQYLDRDASDVIMALQQHAVRTRKFRGIIIPEADHSFNGKEKELAAALLTTVIA